jgi:hypothetical protein
MIVRLLLPATRVVERYTPGIRPVSLGMTRPWSAVVT